MGVVFFCLFINFKKMFIVVKKVVPSIKVVKIEILYLEPALMTNQVEDKH